MTTRSSALICVWYGGALGREALFLKNLTTSSSRQIETRTLAGLSLLFSRLHGAALYTAPSVSFIYMRISS
jgi:hypothetical protein